MIKLVGHVLTCCALLRGCTWSHHLITRPSLRGLQSLRLCTLEAGPTRGPAGVFASRGAKILVEVEIASVKVRGDIILVAIGIKRGIVGEGAEPESSRRLGLSQVITEYWILLYEERNVTA